MVYISWVIRSSQAQACKLPQRNSWGEVLLQTSRQTLQKQVVSLEIRQEGKVPILQLTLTLTISNDFQHSKHTSDTFMKHHCIFFINTHQNLAFLLTRSCLFSKWHIFSHFLSFKTTYQKTITVWKQEKNSWEFFRFYFLFISPTSFDKNNLPFSSSPVLHCQYPRYGLKIGLSWKAQFCHGC